MRILAILCAVLIPGATSVACDRAVRFRPLGVFIDPGGVPLAAYQVELLVVSGDAQVVGVEGGDHSAYHQAPYYDSQALQGGRIILAAFSTAEDLPVGSFRALRVHLREEQAPSYDLRLIVAADPYGRTIQAKVSLVAGEAGGE